jgi:hypothetical protein
VKKQTLCIGLIAIIFLANSTSEDTSVEGPSKQKINFYGTLKTWQGKDYSVENIAIGRKFKQIDFFDFPNLKAVDQEKYSLKTNPKNGIVTRIDLSEICEMRVPQPDVIWTYQSNNKKVEYLKVDIVSHDKSIDSYLIEISRKLTCDAKKKGAPTEMVVPFAAIKQLVVKGYTLRDSKSSQELEKSSGECSGLSTPAIAKPVVLPEQY